MEIQLKGFSTVVFLRWGSTKWNAFVLPTFFNIANFLVTTNMIVVYCVAVVVNRMWAVLMLVIRSLLTFRIILDHSFPLLAQEITVWRVVHYCATEVLCSWVRHVWRKYKVVFLHLRKEVTSLPTFFKPLCKLPFILNSPILIDYEHSTQKRMCPSPTTIGLAVNRNTRNQIKTDSVNKETETGKQWWKNM